MRFMKTPAAMSQFVALTLPAIGNKMYPSLVSSQIGKPKEEKDEIFNN